MAEFILYLVLVCMIGIPIMHFMEWLLDYLDGVPRWRKPKTADVSQSLLQQCADLKEEYAKLEVRTTQAEDELIRARPSHFLDCGCSLCSVVDEIINRRNAIERIQKKAEKAKRGR